MTTFAEERTAIESKLSAEFTAAPIAFDNVPDSAALATAKANGSPWVRLTIIPGQSRTSSISGLSSVLVEHPGIIAVQVFIREGQGTAVARALADQIAAVFNHKRFSGIASYSAGFTVVGADPFGYYQINVTVPYRRFTA